MNSLLSYGSDDECEESPDERLKEKQSFIKKDNGKTKQVDVNYEQIVMDMSDEEETHKPSNNGGACEITNEPSGVGSRQNKRDYHRKRRSRSGDEVSKSHARRSRSKDKDKYRAADKRDYHNQHQRNNRDGRSRDFRIDCKKSRDRQHSNRDRRSRSRDRSGGRGDSRRRNGKRSRSKSPRSPRISTAKCDEKSLHFPKTFSSSASQDTGIKEQQMQQQQQHQTFGGFFSAGISGRFREQIEKRKQLWQKKDDDQTEKLNKKVWETTTFARDTDGKVANKFKRLMGIKDGGAGAEEMACDVMRKQEEMFSSMEQQYEVARTATHTMRGVGLGFGSNFQR